MSSNRSSPTPVPAPWTLKARSWVFVLSPISKKQAMPSGWSAPYQAQALEKEGPAGSIGYIMIYSYSESPIGSYDELIYAPGNMKNPDGSSGVRISRIYVSSKESVYNGRTNWNIPKELADFKIEKQPSGNWLIQVSRVNDLNPFFKVHTTRIPILSSIRVPTTTSLLGNMMRLSCPPIPAGDDPVEVATTKWCTLLPLIRGKARLVRFKAALNDDSTQNDKAGDGISFPDVLPWSIGAMLEDAIVMFPEPTWQEKW
ncbi:hypothetical protein DL96DRAFT_1717048 [Flagelloscypha sp. PMI_526]|nr:hypothetical protein DL96DRAFT_1717048 [Flagelloscypha sp. PMI_526]